MGPTRRPEPSVGNYQSALPNISEEPRCNVHAVPDNYAVVQRHSHVKLAVPF